MACGCGKKRAERLAARKKTVAADTQFANRQLEKFGPARWSGRPIQLEPSEQKNA